MAAVSTLQTSAPNGRELPLR